MWPQGVATSEPSAPAGNAAAVLSEERIKQSYHDRRLEHYGTNSSFVRTGILLLRFPAPGIAASVTTYTVPGSVVLELQHIDFFYSEPYLFGSQQFGWRIAVDGNQLPLFASTGFARNDYSHGPLIPTGTGGAAEMPPVYVQSGQTVSIDVVELEVVAPPAAFNANVWAGATMFGFQHKMREV